MNRNHARRGSGAGEPAAEPIAISQDSVRRDATEALTHARVSGALMSREGQRWSMPSADISAAVLQRLRASHGRRPVTPRDAMAVRTARLPWPVLAGSGLAAAAALVLAAMLPLAVSPAGQSVLVHGSLTSRFGSPVGSQLGSPRGAGPHASTDYAAGPGAGSATGAASAVHVADAKAAPAGPLAEEARRLGDDTLRAADRVLSTLQVVPGEAGKASEAAPR